MSVPCVVVILDASDALLVVTVEFKESILLASEELVVTAVVLVEFILAAREELLVFIEL